MSEALKKRINFAIDQSNKNFVTIADDLAAMDQRIDNLDGSLVIKTSAMTLLAANLQALSGICDDIELRKSVATGDVPPLVKGVLK